MITKRSKDMVPLNEVSKDLNRSLEQVRRYVREGKLHAYKVGLQWFVSPGDLKKFKLSLKNKNVEALDIMERVRAVREKIREKYGEIDGLELLDEVREERLNEIEESLVHRNTLVIKIGGSMLGGQDTTYQDLVEMQRKGLKLVVVHGGGKTITEWLAKQGAGTKFVKGQRVTDRATLDVVVAVLAGLVNKEIVAALNNLGGKAIGLSGIDGGLISASLMNKESGYIGKVQEIKTEIIRRLLGDGYITVIAPPCLYAQGGAGEPGFLNVNADAVAGALAKALKADRLIFLTDVPGIYDENKKVISELDDKNARGLMEKGIISEGMIPKIEACLEGAQAVKTCRIIDGRATHALLNEIERTYPGTTVTN